MNKYQLPDHSLKSTNAEIAQQPAINHAPRILVLYGSLREGSYSKKLALQSAEILKKFGAQVKIFDPTGLPVYQSESAEHLKVQQLRELANWSEGMLWSSPELHGNFSAVFKNQIDWIPLSDGSVRPTQGKTLALMQVNGGSQSFNVVNNMRILGRWMRMFTIPNQSSIPKTHQQFDEAGKLIESPYRDRVIDVLEELFKMTILLRGSSAMLTNRYSENKSQYTVAGEILCCS
ncbi:MAG: hypothetical protein OFPI_33860 [Osedax symbiont Rs2]|nr:MAG: hypothetical protein OFPI_33860 [Osedax symbiont Rs2]